jgi:hypothetical protein
MLTGVVYHLEDFHQNTASYDEFCYHLSMDRGIGHGMSRKPGQYPRAMRALLPHGSINPDDKGVDKDIRSNLQEGYNYGFVNLDEAKCMPSLRRSISNCGGGGGICYHKPTISVHSEICYPL